MDIIIAISALIISVLALVPSFTSNKYEKISIEDQVYQRFAQMWYDMDQVFINHPEMHKYFYKSKSVNSYAVIDKDDEKYELAICIAELFSDVFQYTAPMEQYLKKDDYESYLDYKAMIMASPIMKNMYQQYQWHEETEDEKKSIF